MLFTSKAIHGTWHTRDSGSKQCKENQKWEKENWLGGTWLKKHWGDGELGVESLSHGQQVVIPFFWLLSQLVIPHAAVRGWRVPRLGSAHKVTAILWAQDTAPASDYLHLTQHPIQSSSCHFSFAKGLCLSLCYLKHLPETWYKNILLSLKSSGQLCSNCSNTKASMKDK